MTRSLGELLREARSPSGGKGRRKGAGLAHCTVGLIRDKAWKAREEGETPCLAGL